MIPLTPLTRRTFLQSSSLVAASSLVSAHALDTATAPLQEFGYAQVEVTSAPHAAQWRNTHSVLMALPDDALLLPFRQMAGQPVVGRNIGGWYEYKPDYNYKTGDAGLAPGATFGQWTSALARMSATTGDAAAREKVLRLHALYEKTITPSIYTNTRFPAYSLDKIVCGVKDSHALLNDPNAFGILDKTTDAALGDLPGHAVDRDVPWQKGKDQSYDWDESYTLPENLYLVSAMGAGKRYFDMAEQYLDDKTYFDPLARGENVLGGKHGYSYVNALCSAMQAYLVGNSQMHLRAAQNGFDMVEQQSYATGGWAPDEKFGAPGSSVIGKSLTKSHNSFETPCGSYAHMKLTRYLLRATRDGRYGDSMERVMYNTVLGAKPLEEDGRAFYYADNNLVAKRVYSDHRWPCCSGTLPQVAADYGINSYFREPGAVWVNLYIPSKLHWTENGNELALKQEGEYPLGGEIRIEVTASAPTHCAMRLRIPAWAGTAASLRVNGQPVAVAAARGFTTLDREWTTGDRVSLTLPLELRLEPIKEAAPESRMVALLRGPLVLFPLGAGPLTIREADALRARQNGAHEWTVAAAGRSVRLVPFTDVGHETYSTYFALA